MTHRDQSPLQISRSILNQSPSSNILQRPKQNQSPHPYLLTNKRHDSPLRNSVNSYDLNPQTPTLPNIPDRLSPRSRASPFQALSKVITTNIALPVINNGNSTPKSNFSKSPDSAQNRLKEDSASSYRLYNLPALKIDGGRTTPIRQNYPVSSRNIQFRAPGILDAAPISSRTPRAKKFIFDTSKIADASAANLSSQAAEPNSRSRIERKNIRENQNQKVLKHQESHTSRSPFDDDLLKEDQDAEYESLMSKARKYNMMNFYPSPRNQEKEKESAFESLYNKISPRANGNNTSVLRANKSPVRGADQVTELPTLQAGTFRSEENKEYKNRFGFNQGNRSPMRLNELLVDRTQSDPTARNANATPLSGRLRVNKTRFYRKATEEQKSVKDKNEEEEEREDSLQVSVLEIDNEEEEIKVEKPRKKSPNLIFQRNDKRSNTTVKDRVIKIDSKEEVKPEPEIVDDKNMQILFMRSIIDDVNLAEYMWVDKTKKLSKDGSSKVSTDDSVNATQTQKNPRKQKQELRRQVKNEQQKKLYETFTCEVSKILDKESNDSDPALKSRETPKETPKETPSLKPMGQAYQDFFGLLADLDALDSLSTTMQKAASQQKV